MDLYKELNISEDVLKELKPVPFFDKLQDIDNLLYQTPLTIGGYCLLKKTELYNRFKAFYDALPNELLEYQDYLHKHKKDNIFVQLNKITSIIAQTKDFCGLIIVNKNLITSILDKIYALIPDDIKFCLNVKNNH